MAKEAVIVDFNFGQSFQRLAEIKKQISSLNEDTKELAKSTDVYGNVTKEAAIAMEINEASVRALKVEQRQLRKAVDDTTASQDASKGSIEANRKELSRLKAEYIKLGNPTKEQAKRIKDLNDRLKEQEAEIGVTSRNVGNYSESIIQASRNTTFFGVNLGQTSDFLTKTRDGLQASANSLKSYTGVSKLGTVANYAFGVSLGVATGGITLIIAGIASLITYLTQTQRGMDKLKIVTDVLSTAFSVIIDRVASFGEGLFDIISGRFEQGFERLKKSIEGVGDEIRRETAESVELTKASQELRDQEIELIEVNAERRKQIADLRIEAKNELNDIETRKKALNEAVDLEKQILNDELNIARERARISQERLDQGESTAEEIRANAELQAELFRLEEQTQKRLLTLTSERNSLLNKTKRSQAEVNKELEKNADLLKELQDEFLSESEQQIQKINERAEAFRQAGAEEADVQRFLAEEFKKLEEEKSAKLLEELGKREGALQTSADTEILLIKAKYDAEILAAGDNTEKIKEIEQKKNEEVLLKTRELLEGQLQILQAETEKLVASETGGVAESTLSDEDKAALEQRIAEIRAALAALNIDIDNIGKNEDGEQFDLLKSLGVDEEKFGAGIEIASQGIANLAQIFNNLSQARISQLEAERDRALKGAEGDSDAQQQIEKKFNEKIRQEKIKAFERNKKFQILQSTIQMITGIVTAFSTAMQLGPIAGPIVGAILAATVAATGATNIAKIKASKPNFAKGGEVRSSSGQDVGGTFHAQKGTTYVGEDGNAFEVQRGEKLFVLNRGASKQIRSLSALNQSHGGRSFFSSPVSFGQDGGQITTADGGFAVRNLESSIEDRLSFTDAITEAVSRVKPEVSVTEIDRVRQNADTAVTVSELG